MPNIKKIPIAATPIGLRDLLSGRGYGPGDFQKALKETLGVKYCFLLNSGLAAFYLILKALSRADNRKGVLLPAYTALDLVLPIKKLGLKVELCDISLDTFNLDPDLLAKAISKDTLCVLGVHLFGIPCEINRLLGLAREKNIFLVEDAAQAQGTFINAKAAGLFGDLGFFSLNRGKNLPTYSGGCIITESQDLGNIISGEIDRLSMANDFQGLSSFVKLAALSLVTRPFFYGLLYPFISPFKRKEVSGDFCIGRYSDFQAGVGIALLRRLAEFSSQRYQNGMFLINALKDAEGVIIPRIPENTQPAFNRFPVVFEDLQKREKVERELAGLGIESSRMYLRPLHHIFELGYKKEDFPKASYLAGHLLTLPAHPLVGQENLARIANAIKSS
jgi:dTDP-4-amino-4,6-dideoxygalactose transaminase